MLINRLGTIISKLIFCFKINSSFSQTFLFIKNSKKYSSKFKKNIFLGKENNDIVTYNFILSQKNVPVHIRTYSGDFDIFYEVFWKKTYNIPAGLFLSDPQIIMDLGANVGLTSVFFALQYPKAKIYALEAEAENYESLKKNVSFSNNIISEHAAIDTKDGVVFLSSPDLSYNFKISDQIEENSNSVKAYSMQTYMNGLGIDHIDLLKIDIEGLEQLLLKNNNTWLKNVDNIIIELHDPYTIDQLRNDLLPFKFKVFAPDSFKGQKMIYATKNNI
ncbi:FkbM family methyltransferase [Chryseobacterium bernardetii]|uniref:FkbM family methyltransferase n=1 Tax=Chryseobacterium bernardetii TaxID=1241978 RepID=A0A3G6T538_9FLAO|nr:FkbM family methyltransferase [Chryseobacterium bernardetii]AZB24455.1 FkbM family methyltransferase [Chryseobacterium bernardetii]